MGPQRRPGLRPPPPTFDGGSYQSPQAQDPPPERPSWRVCNSVREAFFGHLRERLTSNVDISEETAKKQVKQIIALFNTVMERYDKNVTFRQDHTIDKEIKY